MKMRKLILLLSFVSISWISFSAVPGYKIIVSIEGLTDTVLYLANYYGDKTYLADTAFMNKKGRFVFEGSEPLPGGIYIVAGQSNNKLFELLIDKEQSFIVKSAYPDIFGNLRFEGSAENDVFYQYIRFGASSQKEIERLNNLINLYTDNSDSVAKFRSEITNIRAQIESYKDQLIKINPSGFHAKLLQAMTEQNTGMYPLSEDQKKDSVFMYQYFKAHYWDQFDVADDRLLRTPLYHKKLEYYFNKVIFQQPDSIIREIDEFVKKVESNQETFKYVVWYLTYKYETSMIMGYDEIFVHMVDNYYATNKAFWADSTIKVSLTNKADALRKILIGVTAPNMIIIDTAGSFKSLHHQEAPYIVVIFYETGCGHCKKEMAELKEWLSDDTLDISVFAVNTDTSLVKWKKYIVDNNFQFIHVNATRSITPGYHDLYDINVTPTIFLLNNDKAIIAKRLRVEQLRPFLVNYHLQSRRNK